MAKHFDALCIGNAIVDVLYQVDEDFITRHDLNKGAMTLINATRAEYLLHLMTDPLTQSGGSAGNTAAGMAHLGSSTAYNGKVHDDALGRAFARDIRDIGVTFTTPMSVDGAATARSFIFVTPDGERTMNTYLGACTEFGPDDIDPTEVGNSQVLYMEGYLWDPPLAKEAFRKAIQVARERGTKTSITLSDSFCVDRYRTEFRNLLNGDIDILFANEEEVKSLFECDDLQSAITALKSLCELSVITRGKRGSLTVAGDDVVEIDATQVPKVLDTTGAGDLFAAGFLTGYTSGKDHGTSQRMGSDLAAACISKLGPRVG